jgi:hypothetical protein
MTNLLIIAFAVMIALGGVAAIAEGVMNERASRRSSHGSPADQTGTLADEILEWLKHQQ